MRSDSAASIIGGSAVLFRSGQGRCSRPDVAVIFAASHRLSVSVIIATIAAAAGAIVTSASSRVRIVERQAASTVQNAQQAVRMRVGDRCGIGAQREQRAPWW